MTAKAKRVAYTVALHEGEPRTYGPGDEMPEEIERGLGGHMFEGGVNPHGDPHGAVPAATAPGREAGSIPAKSGAGSGRDNWVGYAAELGVDVDDDDGRNEIIQKISDAGHPVDPQ